MNQQEMNDELQRPGARALLESATLLRLAYSGSDGFPRVVPIGFLWTGSEIVVCTAATAPKVRGLTSRPQVALTIDTGDTPWEAKALLIRGLVTIDIVDGVAEEYLTASKKVLNPDQFVEFERNVAALYDRMARIAIRPQWARFFDFGAGRLPEYLTRLATGA